MSQAFWCVGCKHETPNRNLLSSPYLTISLDKIEHNTRTIVSLFQAHGIAVTGVTKGVCGQPDVAKAMLCGGVSSIGDSRLENIYRLRLGGVQTTYMLLRIPPLSEVEEVVENVNVSLNSELPVLERLSKTACRHGKVHDVILMVELGDLREGIRSADFPWFVKRARKLPGIRIRGIGTNLACFGGVVPTQENMSLLVTLAGEVEKVMESQLTWISGINSSGLELLTSGNMPRQINHARIGEAILLGRETIHRKPWPQTYQDAFLLHAEILELKKKPSLPIGTREEDAFGEFPDFADRGDIVRALLNVGREDVAFRGMTPLEPGVKILGASSGYLAVDVTQASRSFQVGDVLSFSLNYAALLRAFTSEYVKKCPEGKGITREQEE